MIYGYARVSTSGQDLDAQIKQLEDAGCEKIFTEKYSGKKLDRTEFQLLLSSLSPSDTLIVTKLDRFARSTIDALNTIKDLFERNIRIYILNMGIIEDTPAGRLIFTVFSAFAEFERDLIIERTQEGRFIARTDPNYREGRPKKFNTAQLDLAMERLQVKTTKQVARETGISEATLYREKRKRKRKLL